MDNETPEELPKVAPQKFPFEKHFSIFHIILLYPAFVALIYVIHTIVAHLACAVGILEPGSTLANFLDTLFVIMMVLFFPVIIAFLIGVDAKRSNIKAFHNPVPRYLVVFLSFGFLSWAYAEVYAERRIKNSSEEKLWGITLKRFHPAIILIASILVFIATAVIPSPKVNIERIACNRIVNFLYFGTAFIENITDLEAPKVTECSITNKYQMPPFDFDSFTEKHKHQILESLKFPKLLLGFSETFGVNFEKEQPFKVFNKMAKDVKRIPCLFKKFKRMPKLKWINSVSRTPE